MRGQFTVEPVGWTGEIPTARGTARRRPPLLEPPVEAEEFEEETVVPAPALEVEPPVEGAEAPALEEESPVEGAVPPALEEDPPVDGAVIEALEPESPVEGAAIAMLAEKPVISARIAIAYAMFLFILWDFTL